MWLWIDNNGKGTTHQNKGVFFDVVKDMIIIKNKLLIVWGIKIHTVWVHWIYRFFLDSKDVTNSQRIKGSFYEKGTKGVVPKCLTFVLLISS